MSEEVNDAIIDWDGEVSNDGQEFTTLPEGDEVDLTVKSVERGYSKDGTAPQVKLTFSAVSRAGHGRTTVRDYIRMTRKSEWKLCQLFTALGLRRHGETLRLRWDIEGMTCRATVTVDEYTNRDGELKQSNKVKDYLEQPEADGEFA